MQKVASEYLQQLLRYKIKVFHRHTDPPKFFLLIFWILRPSKLIFPLRKVYVSK
ncbi:hypothetical protein O3M35_001236 [Rhynocoris fuscipes]|uniref:Uncharacterized protein n=1 Tax=Rhynocoris fuscipes TaxID=488301 RepID=A0AAW1DPI6_9HEMI